MSYQSKREWSLNQDFSNSYNNVLTFLKKCQSHNLFNHNVFTVNTETVNTDNHSLNSPNLNNLSSNNNFGTQTTKKLLKLYFAYKVSDKFPLSGMEDISKYLKFSPTPNPEKDLVRLNLAKLLSVAIQAHFFMAESAIVLHEPYIYSIPNIGNESFDKNRLGLLYPLVENEKYFTILISDCNLLQLSSLKPKYNSFSKLSIILPEDNFKWINIRDWKNYKNNANSLPLLNSKNYHDFTEQANSCQNEHDFNFGTPLNLPSYMKEDIKQLGGVWANGIKKWFLPNYYNSNALVDYLKILSVLKSQSLKTQ